jgi:ABC-type sugar transport system permease subunit|tara:strand:- start:4168 stop:5073 length:906 start_codon:yes stop_codon:yes gene_type:complete
MGKPLLLFNYITLFKDKSITPFLFLFPALLLLIIFRIFPIFLSFSESFFKKGFGFNAEKVFIGFENYIRLFNDPIIYNSLYVTLIFCIICIPIQIFLGMSLAVLANQRVRGIFIFRSIFMLPIAVSPVVSSTIWQLMLDKTSGMINGVLFFFDLPTQPFFTSEEQALGSVILVACWRGIPFFMLFFLAGLQDIPQVYKEAASVDGANRWQIFWNITFPLLKRVTAFVVVTGTILNFVLLEPILLITRGGPNESTNLIMWEAYRMGFLYGDLGGASSLMSLIVIIILSLVAIEFRILRTDTQ